MNNRVLIAMIVLLVVSCGSYSDVNDSSTNSMLRRDNVPPVTALGVVIPIEPSSEHVPERQNIEYRSIPPASGRHWRRWADCGFYTQSLPDERIVHNLEHGNIVVSYNLVNRAKVTELRELLESMDLFEDWGVARPYEGIEENHVVLTAWGRMHSMVGVMPGEIRSFFKAFAGVIGPEHIPC